MGDVPDDMTNTQVGVLLESCHGPHRSDMFLIETTTLGPPKEHQERTVVEGVDPYLITNRVRSDD